MRIRVILYFFFFVAAWIGIIFRGAYLQVLPNARLGELQRRQFETVIRLEPRRGDILDRSNQELAVSVPAYSLFADPKLVLEPKQTAKKLASYLGMSPQEIYQKFKTDSKRFVWISRRLTPDLKTRIEKLGIKGISFVEEARRIYPNESLAGNVLGFLGQDGQGLGGLEAKYDDELRGTAKQVNMGRDARGRPLLVQGQLFAEQPDGATLQLTLDRELQYNLEQELQAAVQTYQAQGAVGVILDPQTSAVLAMASQPRFNPNHPNEGSPELRRNRTVSDPYEAGSTMKLITMAAGLQSGKMQPNSQFFCEYGTFKIGKRTIHESDTKHKFGWITANEILQKSSNIGVTKIAFQIGAEKLRDELTNFGFGSKSGDEFPGESRGILAPLPWADHQLANISFGHALAVTPLQIANAYAAVANGGTLHRPYIVKSVIHPETKQTDQFDSEIVRQVLSKADASKLTYMLIGATSNEGTGFRARVPGYLVAGKTGTAQKAALGGRGYIKGGYVASFAGFLPAQDPRFVIYIAVDAPKKGFYGGDVAAPIFSRVASFAVRHFGVAPMSLARTTLSSNEISHDLKISKKTTPGQKTSAQTAAVPMTPVPATAALPMPFVGSSLLPGLNNSSLSSRSPVENALSGAATENGGANSSALISPVTGPTSWSMPDLRSLSLREAMRKLNGHSCKLEIQGQGRIVRSWPEAGQTIQDHDRIVLQLKSDE